jgi:hypothetical protein
VPQSGGAWHEPPLIGLLEGKPEFETVVTGFYRRVEPVAELLRAGHMETAAQLFVNTVAFGPGAWDILPQSIRETFIQNAPTFLDETNDSEGLTLLLSSLRAFDRPALVTIGTDSPPFFNRLLRQSVGLCHRAPSLRSEAPAMCRT